MLPVFLVPIHVVDDPMLLCHLSSHAERTKNKQPRASTSEATRPWKEKIKMQLMKKRLAMPMCQRRDIPLSHSPCISRSPFVPRILPNAFNRPKSPRRDRTAIPSLQLDSSLCSSGMCKEAPSTSPLFRMYAHTSSYEALVTFRAGTLGVSFVWPSMDGLPI